MADHLRYSQKRIDVALDELGDIVTRLSQRDADVSQLISDLAERIADLEAEVAALKRSKASS